MDILAKSTGLRISLLCLFAFATTVLAQTNIPPIPLNLDDKFIQLAGQLPGFGGYFFDDNGDLNVYLTDLTREPEARTMFADVAASRTQRWNKPWTKSAAIVIRKGAFDFPTLNDIRTRLASDIGIDGISMYDNDEAHNVVYVAVTSEETRQRVLAHVDSLGLPPNAVTVDVVPQGEPALTSIQSSVRPTVGGLQVEYNSGASTCTLGVNVWYSNPTYGVPVGTEGFYTASHCSTTPFGADSPATVYTQGGTQVGHEMYDPPLFTNAEQPTVCLPTYVQCRWSDVTFVKYDSGVSINHGYLAQTQSRGIGPGSTHFGSLDLDLTGTWTFTITNGVTPVYGMTLEKVGRSSGWTEGNVTNTCAIQPESVNGATAVILCSDTVGAWADNGDSGAPVFQILSSGNVAFSGIVFFKTGLGTYVYSNVDQIARDMGVGVNYFTH